jgi:hypothetical protein
LLPKVSVEQTDIGKIARDGGVSVRFSSGVVVNKHAPARSYGRRSESSFGAVRSHTPLLRFDLRATT